MTVEFTPQAILSALWGVSAKWGHYFPYGLRARYEHYDTSKSVPQFKPYRYDLYHITRFVEEAGGVDADRLLGAIVEGRVDDRAIVNGPGITDLTFTPNPDLPVSEVAAVIMDCKKAGFNVKIDKDSDLSKLINTAALLVEP